MKYDRVLNGNTTNIQGDGEQLAIDVVAVFIGDCG